MNQSILFPDRPLPQSGGRVDTLNNDNFAAFDLYKEYTNPGKKSQTFESEALVNIHNKNDVSTTFFSDQNLDAIQQGIRYYVWKKSCGKYVIDRQSDNEVKVVMRSIYLNFAQHQPTDIVSQVKDLNMRVINYCVDRVLQEIGMYMYYKQDIAKLPDPLARGEFVSSKGEKNDQLKNYF